MARTISLTVKDASPMNAYVAIPRGSGPFPAVIVFHDAFGLNTDVRNIADRLSKEGYVAIVPELFHRTAEGGFSARYYQVSIVMPHVNAMRQEHINHDMQAAYKWLRRQDNVNEDKIGAIGFSMGGKLAFIANTLLKLSASVSFYGGKLHREIARIPRLNAPQLFVWAGRDEHITRSHVATVIDAMDAADKDFTSVNISRVPHGFFIDGHPAYDAQAAKESWGIAKEFLKNKLQSA